MPKFQIVLESQTDEHKRYMTVSTVPCRSCGGGPERFDCRSCGGVGEEEATRASARAFAEAMEKEYVAFRLDDRRTLSRYPTLPENALSVVNETCLHVPEDTTLVDGRFVRAGKVLGQNKIHRGWLHLHLQEKPYRVVSVGQSDAVAVVTAGMFGLPIKNMYSGANVVDWDTDTIKCSLHTSAYTPDIDTHDFQNDTSNEVGTSGTYTTAVGGMTLTASAPTYDTATDQIRLDASDFSATGTTITARIAVVNKWTGTNTTSPLISFVNFGADVSTTAGTFAITWDVTGIVVIDVT